MAYSIKTLPNGHRFAQLPSGELVPNQGRYHSGHIMSDAEIEVNFCDYLARELEGC